MMHGTADLATILNPPRGFALQYGQGRVISWEAKTGHNTIEWAGAPIHDVPVFADINALTIQSEDIVGMLGWTSPEGVSSWWVMGRIVPPGEGATDLVIYGNLAVANGASIISMDGGPIRATYPDNSGAVSFGSLVSSGDGSPIGTGLVTYRHPNEGGGAFWWVMQRLDGGTEMYAGAAGSPIGLFSVHAADTARVVSDGQARLGGFGGTYLMPESGAGDAEVRMEMATGRITYVPIASTARVKRDIQDLDVDAGAVLRLRPRSWVPAPVERQCPEWMHAQHSGEECHGGEVIEPPGGGVRQVGFIAEELDEIGLGDFVEYDEEGLPAAISYDRLTAALVPVLQQQQAQIEALTARLDALEQPEEGS